MSTLSNIRARKIERLILQRHVHQLENDKDLHSRANLQKSFDPVGYTSNVLGNLQEHIRDITSSIDELKTLRVSARKCEKHSGRTTTKTTKPLRKVVKQPPPSPPAPAAPGTSTATSSNPDPPPKYPAKKMIIPGDNCKLKDMQEVTKELAHKSIMVIGLLKNIGKDIHHLKFFVNELKTLFGKVSFFYLTNNNTDDTLKIMQDWAKNDASIHGKVLKNQNIITVETDGQIGDRVVMFAKYRNMLFKEAKKALGTDYDYMLQLDTDLVSKITAKKFATCFELDEDFDIICANGVFRNSDYHYDIFALRLFGDPDYVGDVYKEFYLYYGLTYDWITRMHVFDEWTRVKSAWGGMMLYPKKIFELDRLYDEKIPKHECEHLSLCRNFFNIYINPHLTYMQEYDTEGQCYSAPLLFIPRDAGMFSVFNFFIGMLTLCGRVYPYWNYKKFVEVNGSIPQHFCYFNEHNDNCWFDFFDRIQFFEGDDNHKSYMTSNALSKFKITQGCEGPEAFRIPAVTNKLLSNADGRFSEWRHSVHLVFKKYIKLNKELQSVVDDIGDSLFKSEDGTPHKVIGVHFRHPSHCCEQGYILLKDYFEQVDKILEVVPDAQIYLATDTDFSIAAFRERYSNKLCFVEGIARTSMDNLLEWAYARGGGKTNGVGFIGGKGFELQHVSSKESPEGNPQLGKDVIVDVYCLAKCDWFIHTVSNLSLAVSYINPTLKMIKL